MTKKVLFLYPNTTMLPAIPGAIAVLSGVAKSMDWESYYFDTYSYQSIDSIQGRSFTGEFKSLNEKVLEDHFSIGKLILDFQSIVNNIKPDVLAISCMTIDYEYLLSFYRDIILPINTVTIIGGLHAIICSSSIVNDGLFDIICIGEGEEVFSELLSKIENGFSVTDINGTISMDRRTRTVKNNDRRKLLSSSNLWEIKANYSIFTDEYFSYPFDGKMYRRFEFEVAQGCVYSCAYCGNTALKKAYSGLGQYVRQRPVDSAIAAMRELVDNYNIELLYLQDECFLGHPVKWLKEFMEKYAKYIRLPFIVQTRPETITPEKLDLMDKMGAPFYQVSVGVESGSERILFDVCKRRTKKQDIVYAFNLLKERKIRSAAFFLIGIPYETRDEIMESVALCREINPTVAIVSIFQPLPGQELREICIKERFITGNESQISFTKGSILRMPQLSVDEILNLRRVFMLYAFLPLKYWPEIEQCERNYEENQELYDALVKLRWENQNYYNKT